MSNFAQAVSIMNDRWLDSLEELEDYEPSKKHVRAVKRICDKMRGGKYHRFTRRATALIIAAAILLSAGTVVVANEATRDYIIQRFKEFSIYRVEPTNEVNVEEIEIGYIPEGFKETERVESEYVYFIEYRNGDKAFSVNKFVINAETYYDSEEKSNKTVEHNGIEYIIFYSNNDVGIIWNNGKYSFKIEGNLSEQDMINIAFSTN